MGRPPGNGVPSFRFNSTEVAEMESVLRESQNQMPTNDVLTKLAEKFSASSERSENSKYKKKRNERAGNVVVQMKQVWNWFQNRRFAIRAKGIKIPGVANRETIPKQGDSIAVRNIPHPTPPTVVPPPTAQAVLLKSVPDNTLMEFEAKSAQDGAWYDVEEFLSHRSLETGDLEVQVRFSGFGVEEVEWVNVLKHVRQRSLPCESTECVSVLPGDLILCFQEGKEQALYFDAHVLNAQRRSHDVRGCRCRFLVRYDHNLAEEIVPLRKICRRPETDYRLQQLHARNSNPVKAEALPPPAEAMRKPVVEKAEQTFAAPRANNLAVTAMETKVAAQVESITVKTDGNMGISIVTSPPVINKTAEKSDVTEVTAQIPYNKPSDVVETSKIGPVIAEEPVSNATAAAVVTNGVLANTVVPPAAGTISNPKANDLPDDVTVAVTTAAEGENMVIIENSGSCLAKVVEEPGNVDVETSKIGPVNAEEPVSNATAAAVVTNGVLANTVVPSAGTISNPKANDSLDDVIVIIENSGSCVAKVVTEPGNVDVETSKIGPVIAEEPVSNATAAAVETNGVLVNAVVPPAGTISNPKANDSPDDATVAVTTAAEEENMIIIENSGSFVAKVVEEQGNVDVETSKIGPVIAEESVSNATNGVLANTVVPPAAGTINNPKTNDSPDDVTVAVTTAAEGENMVIIENSGSCVAKVVEESGKVDVESVS